MAIFEEEEKHSQHEIYQGDASLGKRALQRVLMRKQLEQMGTELREIMVYQTPGLADLYSQTYKMREVISQEQEKARLKEEAQKRQDAWLHRQEERNLQAKLAAVVATSIFLLYLWLWLLLVSRWGKA
jgi:hypothetical protein